MSTDSIVALTFLILGLGFMITLFMSLFKFIGMKKTADNFNGSMIIKAFGIPLLLFIALMIFIIVILPRLS